MQLHIVNLSDIREKDVARVNNAYDLWYRVNAPTAESVGEELKPDEFFRAKICLVLEDKDRVIGMSMANFLDFRINGLQNHTYLSLASSDFRKRMAAENKRVYSIEWVSIEPEMRGSIFGAQLGHVIMGLSIYTMRALGFDCVMGYSRTDLKVDKIVEIFGGERVELTEKFDTECGVMVVDRNKIKPHPRKTTQALLDQIWNDSLQFDKGRNDVTAA